MSFRFQIEAHDDTARAGRFFTPHGEVQTPVFMPVARWRRSRSLRGVFDENLVPLRRASETDVSLVPLLKSKRRFQFNPDAFNVQSSKATLVTASDWMYFSFRTLTTLGYGDIVLAGTIVRVIAIGEALAGQLYLAVMIGRLVAMEVVTWQEGTFKHWLDV